MKKDHEIHNKDGEVWASVPMDRNEIRHLAVSCSERAAHLGEMIDDNEDLADHMSATQQIYLDMENDLRKILVDMDKVWNTLLPPT